MPAAPTLLSGRHSQATITASGGTRINRPISVAPHALTLLFNVLAKV